MGSRGENLGKEASIISLAEPRRWGNGRLILISLGRILVIQVVLAKTGLWREGLPENGLGDFVYSKREGYQGYLD